MTPQETTADAMENSEHDRNFIYVHRDSFDHQYCWINPTGVSAVAGNGDHRWDVIGIGLCRDNDSLVIVFLGKWW